MMDIIAWHRHELGEVVEALRILQEAKAIHALHHRETVEEAIARLTRREADVRRGLAMALAKRKENP